MISLERVRRYGLLLAVALGSSAACMGSGRPKPAAGGTLRLGNEGTGPGLVSGPLQVAYTSPEGPAELVTEISVVFDRPVHPLGLVSPDAPAPFRITPAVPGSFRWVGSRAIVFNPKQRLPLGTEFHVEVPAGVVAIDGTRLAETRRFAFQTRRPELWDSSFEAQPGLALDAPLELNFNLPVAPEALRQATTFFDFTREKAVPFDVVKSEKSSLTLVLRPKQPLRKDTSYEVTIATSLRGSEGPLGLVQERKQTFHTYGPLRLDEVTCSRQAAEQACDAEGGFALSFSNAVKPSELNGKLHITPDVGRALGGAGESASSYLQLSGRFEAGRSYSVVIDPGVTDEFGQVSAAPMKAQFRLGDYRPRVDIGVQGRHFAGKALSVPIASRNVPSYELLTAVLTPNDLISLRVAQEDGNSEEALKWLSGFKGVQVQKVTPRAPRNQIDKLMLDAAKALGAKGRGFLAVGAKYRGRDGDYGLPPSVKLLDVSNLAITAKLSSFGSQVWVTERGTNAPVPNANVALWLPEQPPRRYLTDADGLAKIPASDYRGDFYFDGSREAIFVAERGDDSVFAPVADYIEPYRLDVPAQFAAKDSPYGVLFSDRGLYRPGDDVQIKGIIRVKQAAADVVPKEQPITLTFNSPNGEQLSTQTIKLNAYGTFSAQLRVPAGAALGEYYVGVAGFDHSTIVQTAVQVSEYRPAELEVSSHAEAKAYVRGQSAKLEVQADYLYGAPGAGLMTELSVSREPTWFAVPGNEQFFTDASLYYSELSDVSPAGELRREKRKLDEQGRVTWHEKLELPGQRGPELLRIDAEVTDVSRRTVAGTSGVLVHPAAFYLGLNLGNAGFLEAPGSVKPQVVALDLDGKRLSGKQVTLELIERRYTFAQESSGDDYRGVTKVVDRVVTRCAVTTAAEVKSCALAVPTAGYYLIVARSKDDHGNPAESANYLYASGSGEPTWQDNERRSVSLVLDKKSYSVGQRAKVLVESSYKEAEAWITVERAGIYQSFHRVLQGTAPTFEIPVTNEMFPNAFVGVHLLPRRSGKAATLDPASYRVGYAPLMLDTEARRLAVHLTPNKSDFRPGENLELKLAVKDARGAAAASTEVTLYAADEGVLSLIGYRTPDPLATFASPRELNVGTLETRDFEGRVALANMGGEDKGRDGGGGGEVGGRKDFRQTAYFNPHIVTDARGEAKVSFKLPESLTSYRLMAVAVGAVGVAGAQLDRYGFAQERVTTSKPLMARPALPRFARAGDRFDVGVIVSKKGAGAGKVRVAATFTGLSSSAPLLREVDVAANGAAEVRFPVEAPQAGSATVRFEITGGNERDVVTQKFPIRVPMAPETVALHGHTSQAQSEKLSELAALRDDAGGLSVSLSSTALAGIEQTALDLIDYPYSCTEQLSSRILPLVALSELSRALGFPLPPNAKALAEKQVGEVLARQQGDGGFSMWPETAESSDWISPFATLALVRAQRAGIALPKGPLDRARVYLRSLVNRPLSQPWHAPTAALALDVLAELGTPDVGGINRLYEQRKELPLFGRALLLHAALSAKLTSDVVQVLRREIEAQVRLNGETALITDDSAGRYAMLYDSEARTQALALRALAAGGKPHALLVPMARGLMGLRRDGRFRTTQEGSWALLALDDFRRVAEPEQASFDAVVTLGGESLARASFKPGSSFSQHTETPIAKLLGRPGAPLVFEKRGSGQLYYEARLRYVRRELPKAPLDAGFFIEKTLRPISSQGLGKVGGAPPGVTRELAAGDLVLVDLTVVSPGPRLQVVIDDPLPAGLEAIDPSLMTTADWLRTDGFGSELDCARCPPDAEPSSYRHYFDRSEVRDDRVLFFASSLPPGLMHYRYVARATTFGHFILPPTRVEQMYEPEVFGRTGATEVTVR